MADLNKTLKWFDNHHRSKKNAPKYSMYTRYLNPNLDCSSAIFYALKAGGFLPSSTPIGNTETLFQLYHKGFFEEIYNYNDVRKGDIFIRGGEGTSNGANGHTGMFYKKDGIVHCNYTNNGISYNDLASYLTYYIDRKRSSNERYFRPKALVKQNIKNNPPKTTGKKAVKISNKKGKATVTIATNVRSYPSTSARILASYRPNNTFYYDSIYKNDGYYWLSYVAWSGNRVYVAYKKIGGKPWIII